MWRFGCHSGVVSKLESWFSLSLYKITYFVFPMPKVQFQTLSSRVKKVRCGNYDADRPISMCATKECQPDTPNYWSTFSLKLRLQKLARQKSKLENIWHVHRRSVMVQRRRHRGNLKVWSSDRQMEQKQKTNSGSLFLITENGDQQWWYVWYYVRIYAICVILCYNICNMCDIML